MYVYIYPHDSNASNVLGEDPPGGSGPVGAPERAYLADKNHFSLLCSSWNIYIGRLSGTSKRVAIEVCWEQQKCYQKPTII